jgi:hypothetical protein
MLSVNVKGTFRGWSGGLAPLSWSTGGSSQRASGLRQQPAPGTRMTLGSAPDRFVPPLTASRQLLGTYVNHPQFGPSPVRPREAGTPATVNLDLLGVDQEPIYDATRSQPKACGWNLPPLIHEPLARGKNGLRHPPRGEGFGGY